MIHQGQTIENRRTGQRMTFLKTWADTNGTLLQIECFSPVTSAREPEHIHPYQENRFRLLKGELAFIVKGKNHVIRPGESICIPKNVAHHFWNCGTTEAQYIQEFVPALKTDTLFETFFALARDGKLNKHGAPHLLQTSLIMLEHNKEIRLASPPWWLQKCLFMLLAPIARLFGYKARYE
jgi:mannose-6-phosphate isomerase-like protein (cupin superfamily)